MVKLPLVRLDQHLKVSHTSQSFEEYLVLLENLLLNNLSSKTTA